MKTLSILLITATLAFGQTISLVRNVRDILRPINGGTGTQPGTSLPSTCSNGSLFFKTNAVLGSNIYGCMNNVWTLQSGAGGGVSIVTFTGGIISVANQFTTPALTVAMTSGGIVYGSSSTTWASSAALGAGQFVLGGGAGSPPTTSFSIVPGANGGTGNGFFAIAGPASTLKTHTWPNASINFTSLTGVGTWATGTPGVVAGSAGDCVLVNGTSSPCSAVSVSSPANPQTGTTYTILTGDLNKTITASNAAAQAYTLPEAGGSFPDGWLTWVKNIGAGDVTITPTTSTISGAASIVISNGEFCRITSNGTNYEALCDRIVAGTGQLITKARTGSTVLPDTSVMLSRATDQSGTDHYCVSATGNDTYTCALTPTLTAYTAGGCVVLKPGTANTGAASLNVDTLGALAILTRALATPANGDIPANTPTELCLDPTAANWVIMGGSGGSGTIGGTLSTTNLIPYVSAANTLSSDSTFALDPSTKQVRIGAAAGNAASMVLGPVSGNAGLWFGTNTTTPSSSNYSILNITGQMYYNVPGGNSHVFRINNTDTALFRDWGGIQLISAVEPTCDASHAGALQFYNPGGGVASTSRQCGQNAAGVYSWATVASW